MMLILVSTAEKEKLIKDVVLGRKVPMMVYIKNKALVKQIAKDKLMSDV